MTQNDESTFIDPVPNSSTLQEFKPSAVLLPLFQKNFEDHLLFTVRNHQVKHHKGEICFPGGVYDKSDQDLLKTALRETEEEMGIQQKDIHVLGELEELITPTYYRISPFVGRIPYPYSFQVNKQEVEEVIEIPLSYFMDETRVKFDQVTFFGKEFKRPSYQWNHHLIWGATAMMVRQLVKKLKNGEFKTKQLQASEKLPAFL